MLSQYEIDQINEWMKEPGNLMKLSPMENCIIQQEFLKYMENIAPIIERAMVRDSNTKFLLRM